MHSYLVLYSNPSPFSESVPSSTPIPPNRGTTLKRARSDESPPGSALITNGEEQSPKAAKKKRRVQPSSTVQPKAPDLCPRSETVTVLAKMLEEQSIVHVRGTPASGKTSLAMLLRVHLTSSHNVIFIPEWTSGDSPGGILVKECQKFGYDVSEMDLLNSQDGEFVFIIDEAQLTYTDSRLWYRVIKSRLGSSIGPWFCLFASYGSPSNGSPDYPTAVTPPARAKGVFGFVHDARLTWDLLILRHGRVPRCGGPILQERRRQVYIGKRSSALYLCPHERTSRDDPLPSSVYQSRACPYLTLTQ